MTSLQAPVSTGVIDSGGTRPIEEGRTKAGCSSGTLLGFTRAGESTEALKRGTTSPVVKEQRLGSRRRGSEVAGSPQMSREVSVVANPFSYTCSRTSFAVQLCDCTRAFVYRTTTGYRCLERRNVSPVADSRSPVNYRYLSRFLATP